jgi:membrane protein implicated in regulation of membrane protease activity
MKNFKQKLISVIIGGIAFYSTTMMMSPMAMWLKFAAFIVVSLFVYLVIKPKKTASADM